MNKVDTVSNNTKNTNSKISKILNTVWDVFKGLIIAIAAVVLIGDTVVLYMLYDYEQAAHSVVELHTPYYMETQDYLDLMEMYNKDPEHAFDNPEYKAMLKAFNAKYSVPYKGMQAYIDLAEAHRKDPNSEEYNKLLKEFLEVYDIEVEKISFED